MAKYIVDIANDDYMISFHGASSCSFKKVTDLKPYTEPDREAIENEVADFWKTVRDIDALTLDKIFGEMNFWTILNSMSYQEAKEKYDEWVKEKSRIRVGDEVIIKYDSVKGVVLDEDVYGEFSVFTENGCCEAYRKIDFEKTGRHLDGVEKLLEEMRKSDG